MPSRYATVTDQMHELLDELRALAQKELGHHGEIAADSQKVAVMLDISSLESTINGIEPFDLLALRENDLEGAGVDQARQAYNARPQETNVFLVQVDEILDDDVERLRCMVSLGAGHDSKWDAVDTLSPVLGVPANTLEVVTMNRVRFHGDSQ